MTAPNSRQATGPGARARLLQVLLAAAVLLALVAWVHPDVMLRGKVYASSDAENSAIFTIIGDRALADGHYPEWNPYLFVGMPTFGSLSYTRFVYPPGAIFTFLQDRLGFPPLTWMLFHLLFGGVGMIWLLRRWRVPTAAALLAAAVWLLTPKIVAWGVHGHGSKLVTAMYLPWVVGACLDVLEGRGRRAAGWLAAAVGLQMLRGHVQIIYYTLLLVGSLVVGRWIAAFASRRRGAGGGWPWRGTLGVAVGLALAFAIGAVLLLPVHEYAGWSVRGASEGGGAGYQYATGWSQNPRELTTLVDPAAAGFGLATYQGFMSFTDYPNYLGWLLLSLAALGAWVSPRWPTRTLLWAGLAAVLVACGRYLPILYGPMYHLLPYFNKFRIPSMILVLTTFAAAVLAARGAAALAGGKVSELWMRRLAWAWFGLGVALLLGALGPGRGIGASQLRSLAAAAGRGVPGDAVLAAVWRLQRADLVRIGCLLTVAGGALLAVRGRPAWRARLPWLLVVLAAIDLGGVDRRITHPERGLEQFARTAAGKLTMVPASALVRDAVPRSEARADPFLVNVADKLGHERLWPLSAAAQDNTVTLAGIRSLGGYHPAKPEADQAVFARVMGSRTEPPAGRVASWLGAGLVMLDVALQPQDIEYLKGLGADLATQPVAGGKWSIYRNRSALPRARLVSAWSPATGGLDDFLDRLQAGREPVADRVLLDRTPVPAPVATDSTPPPVAFVRDALDEVVLKAAPTAPAVLVLADLWLPGWSAAVDGDPAPLLVADHMLRAVALPAGEHEVRFRYRDPALHVGLMLSIAGVLLTVALLVFGGRRRRGADGGGGS